jgi:hypothetical protein
MTINAIPMTTSTDMQVIRNGNTSGAFNLCHEM